MSFTTYWSGRRNEATFAGNKATTREDVSDTIVYVSPHEVPLLNSLERKPVSNTYHEWLFDQVGSDFDSTDLAVDAEYADHSASPTDMAGRTRVGNYVEINSEDYGVSSSQAKASEYGIDYELDHQAYKKTIELAQKFERHMLWQQEAAGTAASPSRKMHGIIPWAVETQAAETAASECTIGGTVLPTYFSSTWYMPTAAADISREELHVKILEPAYLKGVDFDSMVWMCGLKVKRILSEMCHVYSGAGSTETHSMFHTRTAPAAERALFMRVDYFETDVGTLAVNKNRYLSQPSAYTVQGLSVKPEGVLLGFDPAVLRIAEYRGFFDERKAITKSGREGWVEAELGIQILNPRGIAGGHNLAA